MSVNAGGKPIVTDKLIHFDFLRVQENTKVNVEITV